MTRKPSAELRKAKHGFSSDEEEEDKEGLAAWSERYVANVKYNRVLRLIDSTGTNDTIMDMD